MKKSMSPEYLGKPCQETARAPTTRNSTLFERKHSINSRESFVSGISEIPLLEPQKDLNSLLGRHGLSLANVSLVGLVEALENANDLLHTFYFTSKSECAGKVFLYRKVADLASSDNRESSGHASMQDQIVTIINQPIWVVTTLPSLFFGV